MAQTNFNQIPGRSVPGGDITAYNNSATAIAAGKAVVVDTGFVPTGDAVMGVLLQTASGSIEQPAGITVETIPANSYGRVRRLGAYPALSTAGCTVGDFLMIDGTTGNEGNVLTKTNTHAQLGSACNSAGAGDYVLVEIAIARNA